MSKNEQNEQKKKNIIYECKICDYFTSKKTNYERHNESKKHLKQMKQNETNCNKTSKKEKNCYYECEFCDEIFNSRTTLWRHKKNYHSNDSIEYDKNEEIETKEENKTIISNKKENTNNVKKRRMGMVMNNMNCTSKQVESLTNIILLQNKQIEKALLEKNEKQNEFNEKQYDFNEKQNKFNEKILDIVSKPQIVNNTINNTTNNTNNNNTTNNMTINVFLNEKCKDAVNLLDFVNNLNITWDNVKETGKSSLENTISNLLIKNMKEMDITKRPIHCTDKKRLQYYVKDGEWKKQNADEVIDDVIYNISKRHTKEIVKWGEEHPEWIQNDDNTEMYFNVTTNSMIYADEMNKRRNKVKKLLVDECFLKMPLTFS
jgi:hypothetical protein